MKQLLLLLTLVFMLSSAKAQAPGILWKLNHGAISFHGVPTTNRENEPVATPDGGFIFISYEFYPPKNPSPKGSSDIVLTKVDANGMVVWKKNYGGNWEDGSWYLKLMKANNGGYLFIVNSNSTNGDLPANNDQNNGNLWIGRVDENGNLLQSSILKSDYTMEVLSSATALADGSGYLLTLYVYASGSTLPSLLTRCSTLPYSFKFIKINNNGNVVYQKCMTTDGSEFSKFTITRATNNKYFLFDNGYVSGGNCITLRPPSISLVDDTMKVYWTKPITDYNLPHANYALSSNNILVQNNNSFIIPLYNTSVCKYNGSPSANPLMILKIDSAGTLIWKKQTSELSGKFSTPVDGGDGNSFLVTRRPHDIYTSKLDSNVILRIAYANGDELGKRKLDTYYELPWVFLDYEEHYPAWSATGQLYYWGFNLGWYPNTGLTNYNNVIIGRLGPVNTIAGKVYFDMNGNGIQDANEEGVRNLGLLAEKSNGHFSQDFTDSTGLFSMSTDSGNYIVSVTGEGLNNYTITPVTASVNHSTTGFVDSLRFGLRPLPNKSDVSVSIAPLSVPRPGFPHDYIIITRNHVGSGPSSGLIKFKKPANTTFVSSSRNYSSLSADTIAWNYSNLGLLRSDTLRLRLQLAAPPLVNINDTLRSSVKLVPTGLQTDITNDVATLNEVTRGAYDPNDKQERNAGRFSTTQLASGEYLQYTIRFQNTGNYPAVTVMIRDTLSSDLDWKSLKMIGSSHYYDLSIKNENQVEWLFNNINLADSVSNEPASHGYLVFQVKPKSTLASGSQITNRAGIYFDYNPPVITNTQVTTLYTSAIITPVTALSVQELYVVASPNPSGSQLRLKIQSDKTYTDSKIVITSIDGKMLYQGRQLLTAGLNWVTIPASLASQSTYLVTIYAGNKNQTTRVIRQ